MTSEKIGKKILAWLEQMNPGDIVSKRDLKELKILASELVNVKEENNETTKNDVREKKSWWDMDD